MIYFAHGDEVHELATQQSNTGLIIIAAVLAVLVVAVVIVRLKLREQPDTGTQPTDNQ